MEDSVGAPARASAVPLNTEDEERFKVRIQDYLQTIILSASDFLKKLLKVHLLSVSSAAAAAAAGAAGGGAGAIRSIKFISSWGNHATAVCFVKSGGGQEGRVTACLKFNPLPMDVGVVTNRYDSPQGVVQIVFPKLVEKVREIMVLGNVPLEPDSWTNWERTITDSVLGVLNSEGITAGRNELERKLAASFQRIRHLSLSESEPRDKQIELRELREIRVKYCDLLLDLLRDDLLHNYGGTVQQGLLGTINPRSSNNNDDYNTHNGKPVTDPTLRQAAYNVLFLINIDIGGHIYTVHMDIDRQKVDDEISTFQSVSYWVGGVIEYIHHNKAEFMECVIAALSAFSARTPRVGPEQAEVFKRFVIEHLTSALARADIPLQHDAFILSCKSVTLINDNHSDPPMTPEPINDNTVGINHQGAPFSSFKKFSFNRRKDITGVNFEVYYKGVLKSTPAEYDNCCHFPTYDSRPIDRIIGTADGDSFASNKATYPEATEDSQKIRDELVAYVDDLLNFRKEELENAEAEAEAGEAEAGAGEAEAEAGEDTYRAGPAITLAKTAQEAAAAPEIASAKLLGLLTNPTFLAKKVVGYICDSYNFWMKPRRAGSSSLLRDKGLDIQLLDLVSLGLEKQISNIDITYMVDQIITEIRDSDSFLAFVPINSHRTMLFADGGGDGGGGVAAAVDMDGGGGRRSRRRSVKKKTRRIYYSKRQRNGKKKNISRKYSRCSIRNHRSYSRKNGWQ